VRLSLSRPKADGGMAIPVGRELQELPDLVQLPASNAVSRSLSVFHVRGGDGRFNRRTRLHDIVRRLWAELGEANERRLIATVPEGRRVATDPDFVDVVVLRRLARLLEQVIRRCRIDRGSPGLTVSAPTPRLPGIWASGLGVNASDQAAPRPCQLGTSRSAITRRGGPPRRIFSRLSTGHWPRRDFTAIADSLGHSRLNTRRSTCPDRSGARELRFVTSHLIPTSCRDRSRVQSPFTLRISPGHRRRAHRLRHRGAPSHGRGPVEGSLSVVRSRVGLSCTPRSQDFPAVSGHCDSDHPFILDHSTRTRQPLVCADGHQRRHHPSSVQVAM